MTKFDTSKFKHKGPRVYSVDEYIAEGKAEPCQWLIKGLIPLARVGIMAGPPKTNKTTIAWNIARAIGEEYIDECLGHEVVNHGVVMYITNEGGLGEQIRSFGKSEEIALEEEKSFTVERYLGWLEECITNWNVKLVIIDSMYKAFGIDIAIAKAITPILMNIEKISKAHNVTFLFLHHTNRMNPGNQTVADIAGSYDIARSSEFMILLDHEAKTDDEIAVESNLSDEEINLLPRRRILKKFDYRDGGEGYDKYSVVIQFGKGENDGFIEATRYNSSKGKESKTVRIEDLINNAYSILREYKEDIISREQLSKLLGNTYKGLSPATIQNKYMKQLIPALVNKRYLIAGKNRTLKVNRDELFKDDKGINVPF